jgi:feruloyl esterase
MSRSLLLPCLPMAVLAIFASGPSPASAASCESLATFRLPQTTITSARSVSADTFHPPSAPAPLATGAAPPVPLSNLPGFCRVAATLAPTTDSAIAIEVWMPAAGWNHRFQGVGNGGFAGTISYGAMADALRLGNATASTDTGHMGPGGSFGMKHPEKVADWGYRAIHVMTEAAKAIVQEFYGTFSPARCSDPAPTQSMAKTSRLRFQADHRMPPDLIS